MQFPETTLLTIEEVAALLDRTIDSVRHYPIPYCLSGGRRRYRRDDVEAYLIDRMMRDLGQAAASVLQQRRQTNRRPPFEKVWEG